MMGLPQTRIEKLDIGKEGGPLKVLFLFSFPEVPHPYSGSIRVSGKDSERLT